MKEYIVLIAVTVFLLTFPLQYALEQNNHHKLSEFERIVVKSKEIAKGDGYFTEDNIDNLKGEIISTFGSIAASEIIINVTTTPKYRTNEFDERELIYYEVGVPIKRIIAANLFWGISDAENQYYHIVKGNTSSERLMQ